MKSRWTLAKTGVLFPVAGKVVGNGPPEGLGFGGRGFTKKKAIEIPFTIETLLLD